MLNVVTSMFRLPVQFAILTPLSRRNRQHTVSNRQHSIEASCSRRINSRPPNGVLTMVSTLSTKRHRTMHNADTDEEMVSRIQLCGVEFCLMRAGD